MAHMRIAQFLIEMFYLPGLRLPGLRMYAQKAIAIQSRPDKILLVGSFG
jgi:hypothetical protein